MEDIEVLKGNMAVMVCGDLVAADHAAYGGHAEFNVAAATHR